MSERPLALVTRAAGGIGRPVACDPSDRHDVAVLVARIEGEWAHRIELVVCSAGVIAPGDVVEIDATQLDLQLDVMLTSVAHVVSAARRVCVRKGSGHVLATVSHAAILALPGSAAYSAAKAGLRAHLCALSAQVPGTGVAVSGIYPSAPLLGPLEWAGRRGRDVYLAKDAVAA